MNVVSVSKGQYFGVRNITFEFLFKYYWPITSEQALIKGKQTLESKRGRMHWQICNPGAHWLPSDNYLAFNELFRNVSGFICKYLLVEMNRLSIWISRLKLLISLQTMTGTWQSKYCPIYLISGSAGYSQRPNLCPKIADGSWGWFQHDNAPVLKDNLNQEMVFPVWWVGIWQVCTKPQNQPHPTSQRWTGTQIASRVNISVGCHWYSCANWEQISRLKN